MLNKVIASAVIAAVAASPLTSRQDQGTSAVFNCNHDFALTYDDGQFRYFSAQTSADQPQAHTSTVMSSLIAFQTLVTLTYVNS